MTLVDVNETANHTVISGEMSFVIEPPKPKLPTVQVDPELFAKVKEHAGRPFSKADVDALVEKMHDLPLKTSTQEIIGRFETAKKSGDQNMVDAYRTMHTILSTQKKKMWAETLYNGVRKHLSGKPSQIDAAMSKLTPDQRRQFLADVVHTLSVTKGYGAHAEQIRDRLPKIERIRGCRAPPLPRRPGWPQEGDDRRQADPVHA